MLPRLAPGPASRAQPPFSRAVRRARNKKKAKVMCAGRESNSGLVRGRDVYYHCTTGADVVVCQCALHSAGPNHRGMKRCGIRAQTGRGQEAMAQWQRVGFQTQRLGVRIPLASHPFFGPFFCSRQSKKSALPKLGIAPRLPRPQRGVLLLDYFGATAYGGSGYRSRFSTLRRLYATMYNNPPCASIGTRTRILSLEGINTTLVLWTLESCERSASSV